jgi:hypothetical protein
MFEAVKAKIGMAAIATTILFAGTVSAAIDFSAITDLLNVTFDVLDIVVANTSTLINVVVLFATLGLVGIIIYGFIGKLLVRIAGGGMGKH